MRGRAGAEGRVAGRAVAVRITRGCKGMQEGAAHLVCLLGSVRLVLCVVEVALRLRHSAPQTAPLYLRFASSLCRQSATIGLETSPVRGSCSQTEVSAAPAP